MTLMTPFPPLNRSLWFIPPTIGLPSSCWFAAFWISSTTMKCTSLDLLLLFLTPFRDFDFNDLFLFKTLQKFTSYKVTPPQDLLHTNESEKERWIYSVVDPSLNFKEEVRFLPFATPWLTRRLWEANVVRYRIAITNSINDVLDCQHKDPKVFENVIPSTSSPLVSSTPEVFVTHPLPSRLICRIRGLVCLVPFGTWLDSTSLWVVFTEEWKMIWSVRTSALS